MAHVLVWNLFVLLHLFALCSTQISQKSPPVNPKYSKLNLHFDHCRHPMAFSKEKLVCECPEPLVRAGDTCKCEGCIYLDIEEKYLTGASADVPQYIDEILEELDEEEGNLDNPGVTENIYPTSSPSTLRKKKDINEIYREDENQTKPSYSILYLKRANKRHNETVHHEQTYHGFQRMFKQARQFNETAKKEKKYSVKSDRKILKLKGQSFSLVGSSAKGGTHFGKEKTSGFLQSFRGTGSMALASGGGSAGSAAFTGPGKSDLAALSQVASAKGITMIGSQAKNASSTNTVLAGSGIHAAAANALGQKGTASGAAVSTSKVAIAATAAAGNASSSASSSREGKVKLPQADDSLKESKEKDTATSSSAGSSKIKYEALKDKQVKDVDTSSFSLKPKAFNFENEFSRKR